MAALRDWLNGVFVGRPGWMNALMAFCAYMAFVYVPWDFFVKPVAEDQEVWLGAYSLDYPWRWRGDRRLTTSDRGDQLLVGRGTGEG